MDLYCLHWGPLTDKGGHGDWEWCNMVWLKVILWHYYKTEHPVCVQTSLHNKLKDATKYLWINALAEYIDKWTRPYSLVIIYRNHLKRYLTGHKRFLVLAGNLKEGKPMLCCFFRSNPTQIPLLEAFIIIYCRLISKKVFWRKLINWDWKDNCQIIIFIHNG
mgnify:CR=1 FL=1